MPTYEYQCKDCGHELEVFQSISDEPLKECPKCHAASLSKLLSAANFHLKGTGWYATDFRDKGKVKAEPAVKETENKTETKAEGNAKKEGKEKTGEQSTKTGES